MYAVPFSVDYINHHMGLTTPYPVGTNLWAGFYTSSQSVSYSGQAHPFYTYLQILPPSDQCLAQSDICTQFRDTYILNTCKF